MTKTRASKVLFSGLLLTSTMISIARADEVHVLNWKGYGTDEPWAVQEFEKTTGHKVIQDYFNSEQEMSTKIRTNPGLYDVVVINAAFNKQMYDNKLIQPINVKNIPNFADINPDQAKSALLNHDGNVYGVAWVWGLTAMAINDKTVEMPPTSISAMWDEAYKGRVVIRDDAVEAIQIGAIATGQNISNIADLEAVKTKLASLMPQIRSYWSSENDWNQMLASNQIDVGTYWSGSAYRARTEFKLPVTFIIPEEGAIGWLDGLSIPIGSKHVAAAEAFINYMIDPSFYVEWNKRGSAPMTTNAKSVAALPEGAFNRRMADASVLERVQFQGVVTDEQREKYLSIWQDIKVNSK